MSKMTEYLANHDNTNEQEKSPINIAFGFGISLSLLEEIFEEAHRREIDPTKTYLTATSILGTKEDPCGGIYISNSITGRGARLTRNGLAGCGRIYLGDRNTIPFPERIPVEGKSDPRDYSFKELKATAEMVLNHITRV